MTWILITNDCGEWGLLRCHYQTAKHLHWGVFVYLLIVEDSRFGHTNTRQNQS